MCAEITLGSEEFEPREHGVDTCTCALFGPQYGPVGERALQAFGKWVLAQYEAARLRTGEDHPALELRIR